MNLIDVKKSNLNMAKASLLVILSGFAYALMAVFAKAAGDISAMQKVCFRNFFMSIIIFLPLLKDTSVLRLNGEQWKLLILRGLFGTIGVVAAFYTYDHMSLADSTIFGKLAPCFVFITSILLFNENVNLQNIFPLMLAFVGVFLVIKPTFESEPFAVLVAIICAAVTGVARTFITKLGHLGVSKSVIMLSFSILSTIATLPFVIFDYNPMNFRQVIMLLLCTLCTIIGQVTITAAYTMASGKMLSIFEYLQVVFAAIFDLIFFAIIPDVLCLIGYMTIIGAAILNTIVIKGTNRRRI